MSQFIAIDDVRGGSTKEITVGESTGAAPLLPMPVSLTEDAATMVKDAMKQEDLDGYGLRVGVTGGGCLSLIHISEPTRPY